VSDLALRRLTLDDEEAFRGLRQEALSAEPLAFTASPEDDRVLDPEFLRARLGDPGESAIFGAFAGTLVGFVGIYREPGRKADHKARVFGTYVRPAHRRGGVGDALLSAAIVFARALPRVRQIHLGVTEVAQSALRLYLRHGFVVWGTEPAALRHDGRFVAEHHMVLVLS
jgi:ribosomal protein S18 acetylase RimI-like enzyme